MNTNKTEINSQHIDSESFPTLRLLEVRFDLPVGYDQISQWRGACAAWAGLEHDIFHNHQTDGKVKHRYPLVQYRRSRGNAAIFAINEGIEAVSGLLQQGEWSILWQNQPRTLRIEQMHMDSKAFGLTSERQHYRIQRWLALNDDNYPEYRQMQTFRERVALLDRTLSANLLALCGGLGWRIPRRFESDITQITRIQVTQAHDVEMMTFDVEFSTDLVLPDGLGIGKSSSRGYGVLRRMKKPL